MKDNDTWLFINLSIGNNYFYPLREYVSESTDLSYASSISMSANGSRIAISGSELYGTDKFRGFVRLFDTTGSGMTLLDTFVTDAIEAFIPIINVVISGDGNRLAIGALFYPTREKEPVESGVKVFNLIGKNEQKKYDQIGTIVAAGVLGDLPGLRLDLSEDGSKLVIGGRNFDSSRGRVRVYTITTTSVTEQSVFLGGSGSKDHLGSSVSVSGDGKYVAIGGIGVEKSFENNSSKTGAVYVYDITSNQTVGDVIYGASANDATGFSVDLVEIGGVPYVAVASIFFGEDTHSDRGKVDIYKLSVNGATWTKIGGTLVGDRGATLDDEDGNYHIGDSFGFSLGLAKMNDGSGGLRVAVGSPFFQTSERVKRITEW